MGGRVLDTNQLIRCWQAHRPQSETQAQEVAQKLISLTNTNAIVTPVRLEFLSGSTHIEMPLAIEFLRQFDVIDQGHIADEDWLAAERFIKRAGRRPRGVMDCLIRAISDRLNYDVLSDDTGMPVSDTHRRKSKSSRVRRKKRH